MKTKQVKKDIALALRATAMVILLCGMGCTSYRVCGYAPTSLKQESALKRTYRLRRLYVRNSSAIPLMIWTTEYAFGKTPASEFERLIVHNHPGIFDERVESVPVEIEISLRGSSSSMGWTILVPYLITLGICPAYMQYDDVCAVTVRRLDTQFASREKTFTFQQKAKVTALSPIGLGGFDPDPTATSERQGNGVFATPELSMEVRGNVAEALAETIAATVVSQLRQMEGDEANLQAQR